VAKIISLEEENHGRFVEFPPVRPVLAVDESKKIRYFGVSQEDRPSGELQCMIKTARYFDDLHGERQVLEELANLQ
jgi:hypothetical protein